MILFVKTAGAETEIGIVGGATKTWEAGRALSKTLLPEMEKLVGDWSKLTGIVVFTGPGSFTGLRIGLTTANSIAYSLQIPIAGAAGDNWIETASAKLPSQKIGQFVFPDYGAPANITLPKAK